MWSACASREHIVSHVKYTFFFVLHWKLWGWRVWEFRIPIHLFGHRHYDANSWSYCVQYSWLKTTELWLPDTKHHMHDLMEVYKRWYLGFGTLLSGFFFPRAFGGAGINSSEDGTGRSADVSTFGVSGLPLPLDFFCFVDTSDKSRGLALCWKHPILVKIFKA